MPISTKSVKDNLTEYKNVIKTFPYITGEYFGTTITEEVFPLFIKWLIDNGYANERIITIGCFAPNMKGLVVWQGEKTWGGGFYQAYGSSEIIRFGFNNSSWFFKRDNI